jgi:membrane-associated phospholipid phosphatase
MFKNFKVFFSLYFLYFLICLVFLFLFEKGEIELLLNNAHHPILDSFFYYWTYAGDGIAFAILGLILLMIRYNYVIILVITILVQTISVQIFKRHIFGGILRPKAFFEQKGIFDLYYIEGMVVHTNFSFPSGHTATGFAIATILAYIFKENKWFVIFSFIGAVLVGISRMYLMQHFFIDTLFGSLFGVTAAILGIKIVEYYKLKTSRKWFLEGALLKRSFRSKVLSK